MIKIAIILTVLAIVFSIFESHRRPLVSALAGFFIMSAVVAWMAVALGFAWRL